MRVVGSGVSGVRWGLKFSMWYFEMWGGKNVIR